MSEVWRNASIMFHRSFPRNSNICQVLKMSLYFVQFSSMIAAGKSGVLTQNYDNPQDITITNRTVYNKKAEQVSTGLEQGALRDYLLSFKMGYTATKISDNPNGASYSIVAVFKPSFDPSSNVTITFHVDTSIFGVTINKGIVINNNPGQQVKYKCTSAFEYYSLQLEYGINYAYLGIGYTISFTWQSSENRRSPPQVIDEFYVVEIKQLPVGSL